MGMGAEWVSKKAREKVIFKLDFEGQKKNVPVGRSGEHQISGQKE